MTISVRCPACQKQLTGPDKLAGWQVKCPKCGTALTIPADLHETTPPLGTGETAPAQGDWAGLTATAGTGPSTPRKTNARTSTRPWLIAGLAGAVLVVLVIAGALLLSKWKEDREDREIAERVRGESVAKTVDASRQARAHAEAVGKKTDELLGGFGDIHTKEQAQKCVEQALSAYIARKDQGLLGGRLQLTFGSFTNLLDFQVKAVTERDDAYVLTVNARVEESAGPGVLGGGPTRTRQVRFALSKKGGILERGD